MKHAAQLQEALERYRQLCQEIERLKYRLVGGDSFPVNDQDWEVWKHKDPRRAKLELYPAPPPELCDDPDFCQLLVVHEEMFNLWWDIAASPDSDQAQHDLLKDVIDSFPSLKSVRGSSFLWMALYQVLDDGEGADPQAYYAASFVEALHWHGIANQWNERRFYIDKAFAVWDQAHKEAFIHWTTKSFFPLDGFYEPSIEPPSV